MLWIHIFFTSNLNQFRKANDELKTSTSQKTSFYVSLQTQWTMTSTNGYHLYSSYNGKIMLIITYFSLCNQDLSYAHNIFNIKHIQKKRTYNRERNTISSIRPSLRVSGCSTERTRRNSQNWAVTICSTRASMYQNRDKLMTKTLTHTYLESGEPPAENNLHLLVSAWIC